MANTWTIHGQGVNDEKNKLYYHGAKVKEAFYQGQQIWGKPESGQMAKVYGKSIMTVTHSHNYDETASAMFEWWGLPPHTSVYSYRASFVAIVHPYPSYAANIGESMEIVHDHQYDSFCDFSEPPKRVIRDDYSGWGAMLFRNENGLFRRRGYFDGPMRGTENQPSQSLRGPIGFPWRRGHVTEFSVRFETDGVPYCPFQYSSVGYRCLWIPAKKYSECPTSFVLNDNADDLLAPGQLGIQKDIGGGSIIIRPMNSSIDGGNLNYVFSGIELIASRYPAAFKLRQFRNGREVYPEDTTWYQSALIARIPITKFLYIGSEEDAPDWAKTITEEDLDF